MLLLLRFFLIIHKTLILQGFRLLWNKNKRDRKMRNTWTHLMVSDTFYFIVDNIVFCPKDDKPYCPLTNPLSWGNPIPYCRGKLFWLFHFGLNTLQWGLSVWGSLARKITAPRFCSLETFDWYCICAANPDAIAPHYLAWLWQAKIKSCESKQSRPF